MPLNSQPNEKGITGKKGVVGHSILKIHGVGQQIIGAKNNQNHHEKGYFLRKEMTENFGEKVNTQERVKNTASKNGISIRL